MKRAAKKTALCKMKENSVEEHLIKQCEKRGGFALKMNPNWYKGIPDRLCALPGMLFFAELKRPKGGKVSRIQRRWESRCKKLGIPHFIFSTKAQIDDFMAAHDFSNLRKGM